MNKTKIYFVWENCYESIQRKTEYGNFSLSLALNFIIKLKNPEQSYC